MVQKATRLPTKSDYLLNHELKIKELFGTMRKRVTIQQSGLFGTTPLGNAIPSSASGQGGTGNFLSKKGDSMLGPIAFFPVDVGIDSTFNNINIRPTAANPPDYSTYVLMSGDTLQYIDGAQFAGQYLILQGTNQQSITVKSMSGIFTIDTISGTGSNNIITVVTDDPHGFSVGEVIQIDNTTNFNSRALVLTVPDANTFTYDFGALGSAVPETSGTAKNGTIVTSNGSDLILDGTLDDLNAPAITLIFDITIPANGAWRVVGSTGSGGGGVVPDGTANNDHLEWNQGLLQWEALQILQFGQGTVALTGLMRFSNDEITHGWRNFLNTGDVLLKLTTSDLLQIANNTPAGQDVGIILTAQDPSQPQNDFLIEIENGSIFTSFATLDTTTGLFRLRMAGATRLDLDVTAITAMTLTSPSAQSLFTVKSEHPSDPVNTLSMTVTSGAGTDALIEASGLTLKLGAGTGLPLTLTEFEMQLEPVKIFRIKATSSIEDAQISISSTNPLSILSRRGVNLNADFTGFPMQLLLTGDLGGDELVPAQLIFKGDDSAGNKTEYGIIKSRIKDPLDGSERGNLEFEVMFGGGLIKMFEISGDNTNFGIRVFERMKMEGLEQFVINESFLEFTTSRSSPGQTGIIRRLFTNIGNDDHLSVVTPSGIIDLEEGAAGVGGAGLTFASVVKSIGEPLSSSTVFQDDDELTFVTEPNSVYGFKLMLLLTHEGGEFKFRWTLPTGASGTVTIDNITSFSATATQDITIEHIVISPGTGTINVVVFEGRITTGSEGGPANLQWAQNISDASPSTVLQGSYLRVFSDTLTTTTGVIGAIFAKVIKTADQTVTNSTVFVEDTQLKFIGTANKTYHFELVLYALSEDAALNTKFTLPSGAVGEITNTNALGKEGTDMTDITADQSHNLSNFPDSDHILLQGKITMGSVTGACALNWTQFTAEITDTIVQKGSALIVYEEGSQGDGAVTAADIGFEVLNVSDRSTFSSSDTIDNATFIKKWEMTPPLGLTDFDFFGDIDVTFVFQLRRVSGPGTARAGWLQSDDNISWSNIEIDTTTSGTFQPEGATSSGVGSANRRFIAFAVFVSALGTVAEIKEISATFHLMMGPGYTLTEI